MPAVSKRNVTLLCVAGGLAAKSSGLELIWLCDLLVREPGQLTGPVCKVGTAALIYGRYHQPSSPRPLPTPSCAASRSARDLKGECLVLGEFFSGQLPFPSFLCPEFHGLQGGHSLKRPRHHQRKVDTKMERALRPGSPADPQDLLQNHRATGLSLPEDNDPVPLSRGLRCLLVHCLPSWVPRCPPESKQLRLGAASSGTNTQPWLWCESCHP